MLYWCISYRRQLLYSMSCNVVFLESTQKQIYVRIGWYMSQIPEHARRPSSIAFYYCRTHKQPRYEKYWNSLQIKLLLLMACFRYLSFFMTCQLLYTLKSHKFVIILIKIVFLLQLLICFFFTFICRCCVGQQIEIRV